jgi:hypothetical protein
MRSLLSLPVITVLSGLPSNPAGAAPTHIVFEGMCDASAAVALDARTFAVADDEDNILRVYDVGKGGPPLWMVDLSPALPLRKADQAATDPEKAAKKAAKRAQKKGAKKAPETDLEAATSLGELAYWLTSHGRNSKGKLQKTRYILFATSPPHPGQAVSLVGQPYLSLLDDLVEAPALRRFDLAAASERPPKEEGGLNIEGLTAVRDAEAMYVGFRNPIPEGKALLVPLLNPKDVLRGQRARLAEPVLLDLGGQGIRSLSLWHGRYLIIAGEHGEGGTSHLYSWTGRGRATPVPGVDLQGFNAEAFFTPEEGDEIVVFSDDGGVTIDGTRCKDLEDPAQKRFRGLRVRPPSATPPTAP